MASGTRKRARKSPERYVEDRTPSKINRGEFSDCEDAHLLTCLLKNGPLDLAAIKEAIPSRNEYQIKQRIASLQKKAQQSITTLKVECTNGTTKYEPRDKVAIDLWIDNLFEIHEVAQIEHGTREELPVRMIAHAMGLIAKYEDHPKPEECGGVDLKNVYGFLENMMMGLPHKALNKADAKFLIEGLARLSCNLDNPHAVTALEKGFLICGRTKGKRPRTYSRKKSTQDEETNKDEILKYLDSNKCNPFQIPKECLKKRIDLGKATD